MHLYLDEELKKAKSEQDAIAAIKRAYDRVEKDYYDIAKASFEGGFAKAAYVGSCAMVSVVWNNKLFVANAGDCKAVLLRRKSEEEYQGIKCSNVHSANVSSEQERLKA